MGDRGRQLAHRRDAVGVRKLHLHLAEGLFGALTLDELTDLAADGSQHVEQLLIGLPDLATEKLDHAQDFPPRAGWESRRPRVVLRVRRWIHAESFHQERHRECIRAQGWTTPDPVVPSPERK